MLEKKFDVIVIGSGPGGYVCSIRLAQLGFNVACIEKRKTLGGTCLNIGCIPSKALLESSEKMHEAKYSLSSHGIKIDQIELDLKTMISRKDKIVQDLCNGVSGLLKKNKITTITGSASFIDRNTIKITKEDSEEIIKADKIVIATGSDVISLPNIEIDEKKIISSTGALSLSDVPKKMIVIGGGYIGLELGSVWSRLGCEVQVIEYLDKIVPSMDSEISRNLQKSLEKQGFNFLFNTKVLSAKINNNKIEVKIEKDKEESILESDIVLVSAGRKACTKGLDLNNIGINLDQRGRIDIDSDFRTNIDNIYAIGDVIKGPMLAHKAEEEGIAVAEIIANQAGHVNYNTIPGVIYTWPEVASVGKTEEELKYENIGYNIGKFPFLANSRARSSSSTEGMVKILSCSKSDKILGVHIIGPHAGTMIAEAVLAMEYSASSEDLARTTHAHPTLNEAVKEAALAVLGRAIHI